MIYSNEKRNMKEIAMSWGVINGIYMGEAGIGRKYYPLPSDENIEKGNNDYLTISLTKSGRPKVVKKVDEKIFLLIRTYGGYTRRGNGYVQKLKVQENLTSVLIQSNGADGMAGRIGQWDDLLVKVKKTEDLIYLRVKPSGGNPSLFLEVGKEGVKELGEIEETMAYFDDTGIDCPFTLEVDGVKLDEWVTL